MLLAILIVSYGYKFTSHDLISVLLSLQNLIQLILRNEVNMTSRRNVSCVSQNDKQTEAEIRPISGWSSPLLSFKDLPAWLRDNEFLLQSHRPVLWSFKECGKTLFRLHTETCNIWTHIIGCFLFTCIMIYHCCLPSPLVEKLAFSTFYVGAIICLGLSSTFHTFTCHSENVAKLFAKLDYCGVIGLIVMSAVPWIYYGFYCRHFLKITYMSFMTVCGIVCITVVLRDKFSAPQYRSLRAGLFVALGLTGVIPGSHLFLEEGFLQTFHFMSWLYLMALLYIAGAIIYAIRVPERLLPGYFDIWGHSHQILHICVVVAALSCFVGLHLISSIRTKESLCDISS